MLSEAGAQVQIIHNSVVKANMYVQSGGQNIISTQTPIFSATDSTIIIEKLDTAITYSAPAAPLSRTWAELCELPENGFDNVIETNEW